MSEEEGRLAGKGYLRVDRGKALEKLSAYGAPDASRCLLPFARAAAALGSPYLRCEGRRDVELVFDGAPLSEADLKDPYAALVAGGAEGPRQLGLGLLACFASGAAEVAVDGGPPERRLRLSARSAREEGLAPSPDGGTGTVVRVRFTEFGPGGEARRGLEDAMAMAPPGFLPALAAVARRAAEFEGAWSAGEAPGRRVVLRPGGELLSRVEWASLGVRVHLTPETLPLAPVDAWIDDPALALNASQSAVVQDDAREAALRRLTEAAWACALARRAERASPAFVSWLRGMAARAFLDDAGGTRAPLLEEPLWPGPAATTRDLHRLLAGAPRVLVSAVPAPERPSAPRVLHCPLPGDLDALRFLFPGKVVDVGELVRGLADLPST